jgi:hypothetical protein
MRQTECRFEAEVLSAVMQSRWPDRADEGLREHAKTCAICGDLAAVAGAIECAREETAGCVSGQRSVPDSARVWWKAQMRARREAVEVADRPIRAVRLLAFTCATGLMVACIGTAPGWLQAVLNGMWGTVGGSDLQSFLPYATALVAGHWMLAACVATLFFVMPVAVYLAIVKDQAD